MDSKEDRSLQGRYKTIDLMLSQCGHQDISCKDGSCSNHLQKYKNVSDCTDGYDGDAIIPVPMNVSIFIKEFVEKAEVNMQFSIKFILVLKLFDRRIIWFDLSDDKNLNILPDDEIQRI